MTSRIVGYGVFQAVQCSGRFADETAEEPKAIFGTRDEANRDASARMLRRNSAQSHYHYDVYPVREYA